MDATVYLETTVVSYLPRAPAATSSSPHTNR